MTKKRIKQICLILVCVIALGAVVGAFAPKLQLSGAINPKRAEKLSLDDYTLVDRVTFPKTQLSEPTWVEYTKEAHSTKVLDDGYRITCDLSTTELYDNGEKKGDFGLSHQTEAVFYPYHNFVSSFKLRGMSGNKTLESYFCIVFCVPPELNYTRNIYYCNILHVYNDGWVYGMDEYKRETKLFQLKDDEYTDVSVKYAADGSIDVYRRDTLIYSTRVDSNLFNHGDLLGVQRAFYFLTHDGIDSNVGASIDLQDIRVYALSEEYDSVNK